MRARMLVNSRTLLTTAAVAGLAVVALHIPASAVSSGGVRTQTTGVYSQSVAGSYVLGAANLDSTDPFNDYAIEGTIPNDVGGVGVLGYASQPKSYAVYGVTFGTNGIGVYGAGDGPTPAPAATPSSTQQSTGVVGNSASGQGVYGSTEFPNHNTGYVTNPAAGVEGVDGTTAGGLDNVGVAGLTTNGAYGVEGVSGNNAIGGVLGDATTGSGVVGFSASSDGVVGLSDSVSNNGYGYPGGYFEGEYISLIAQSTNASGSSNVTYPLDVEDSNDVGLLYTDNSGNTHVHGELYVHGGTTTYSRTRDGRQEIKAFTASTTHPTSEDFGEAQLSSGQSYVRLDPTFARGIDDHTPYMVFVTPEGDTKGLYVTQKSMNGFSVRESQGGRSNMSFSYRIVAVQYGMTNRHIAVVDASEDEGPRHNAAAISADKARLANLLQGPRFRRSLQIFHPHANLAVENRQHR